MSFLKSIWKANTKHTKLSEELALQSSREAELDQNEASESDVLSFKLKYLGSTVVEKVSGDSISAEAVKNIIKAAKAGRKKLQRVQVGVSLKGIAVADLQGVDLFKISIYRISNCSTDPAHRQVFSFISTDQTETMECHAFLCRKRKQAETVTLAVAHAFGTAYEAWRILPDAGGAGRRPAAARASSEEQPNGRQEVLEEKLIDFDDVPSGPRSLSPLPRFRENTNSEWVCFEDDFGDNRLDLKFA